MFYCEKCRGENGWPLNLRGYPDSHGPCEICGKTADCYDVPQAICLNQRERSMEKRSEKPARLTTQQFSVGLTSLSESFGVLMGYMMAVQAKFDDKKKTKALTEDMSKLIRAAQDVARTAEALMELRGLKHK